MALKLMIGNKNYSSWSFRPWIAMKVAGIAFEEEVISLNADDFKARVGRISGTGKVPALADGDVQVWESLAILEYLAEKFPEAGLWPADPAARAHARAVAAEMHAGFVPLRRHLPDEHVAAGQDARTARRRPTANVRRIEAMWTDCRKRYGKGGPFLFGAFGAADAMYAPVVSRFHTYAVEVRAGARLYGRRHGAAGLGGMAGRCAAGALGAARGRGGLADGSARMTRRERVRAATTLPKKCRGWVLIPARGRKKCAPLISTPCSFGAGGRGGLTAGSSALRSGVVIMRYRVIALFSAVLSAFAFAGPHMRAEEAKNDVKGPVPADRLSGRHGAPGHHLYGQPAAAELRAAARAARALGRRRAAGLDRDAARRRPAGRGGDAGDQCQRFARASPRRAEGRAGRHHQPDGHRQGRDDRVRACRSR